MAKEEERVPIYLPKRPDEDETGRVDQTETVIVNGETYLIQRGEHVKVPGPVFEALVHTGRFPNL